MVGVGQLFAERELSIKGTGEPIMKGMATRSVSPMSSTPTSRGGPYWSERPASVNFVTFGDARRALVTCATGCLELID